MVEPIVKLKTHAEIGAAPADWLMVISRPAAVRVPVRGAPALASTVNVKVPFPLPTPPSTTWIHAALLTAFQLHPVEGVVTTATGNVPPFGYPLIVEPIDKAYAHERDGLVGGGVGDDEP